MADIPFPPGLAPRRVTWTLERSVAAFESPLSFASQRVARAGARWRASVEMPPLTAADTGLLTAWLDQISRADNCGLLPAFQNDASGVESGLAQFKTLNPPWADQPTLSAWSHTGLVTPPYLSGGNVVLRANTLTPTPEFRRTFTAVAGLPYFFSVYVPPQQYPAGFVIGNSAFTQLYFDSRPAPTTGLISGVVTSNNTGISMAFTSPVAFQPAIFGNVVLTRCYVAQAAASAGAGALLVNGSDPANQSPTNIVRAIKPGQFVMVRAGARLELKRSIAATDNVIGQTIGSVSTAGSGELRFEPALRGAVALSADVIAEQPFARMRLAEPNSSATIDAPLFGGFAFDLVEWFGA